MNLREFENWALTQKSVGNPTAEGSYKGECVSLIQQYLYKVYGIPFRARGNAKDWANIEIQDFKRFNPSNRLKSGDIVIYDSGKYGHMGIVTINGKLLQQNKDGNRIITITDVMPGYVMIQRPNNVNLGENSNNGSVFQVRVDKDVAYVRKEPNTNSAKVVQPSGRNYLVRGIIFNAVGIVDGEDPYGTGNNKWYKSQKGNFVWSGGLTKLKNF